MDDFLKERIEKYDRWLGEGKISFSSKVIPVGQSLEGKQWVLPTEQALNIVRNASTVALKKCLCREHYSRCDNPLKSASCSMTLETSLSPPALHGQFPFRTLPMSCKRPMIMGWSI